MGDSGSHRSGVLFQQRPHGRPEEFDGSDESYGFDDSAEIPVEVPAGSVVFFNGYLLHRSKKNRSDRYRRALVNHYMSMNSLLPWVFGDRAKELASQQLACYDYRGVHPVCGTDPYAKTGYINPAEEVYLRQYSQ